jgi:hypothetical protein
MADIVKGPADYFALGDFNAECSISGFKRKASKLVKNWQGQYRIPEFNEPRQPQDFVRGVQDVQAPPWVQPPREEFVQICTYNGISAIAGLAVAGCAIAGRDVYDLDYYPPIPPGPPSPPVTLYAWTTDSGEEWTTDSGEVWTTI